MILMLRELIKRTPGGDLMFFQDAYYHCFKKSLSTITKDVVQYRTDGTIPVYVVKYVKYLESLDSEGAHGF